MGTGDEYAAVGWTPSELRHALRRDRVVRVAAGRFAPPPPSGLTRFQVEDLALARRAVAAVVPHERAAVGHLAAAFVRGWPIWAGSPRACATTWDDRVCRLRGVHLHHVADVRALVRLLDLPATSAARTLVDIACEFGTEAAVVSGDVALRTGGVTRASLAAEVEASGGRPGIVRARVLPTFLDPLAESPLESRGRWHTHEHGLPTPYSQVLVHTVEGRFLGRVDHYWPEGVVGEADGRVKYEGNPDALWLEKTRHQALEDVDLEVTRFRAADFVDFTDAAARIRRARERRRRRLADGETPRWVATTLTGLRIPVVAPR